ncbi:MAG: lytic transglycosylase domain-containing protein [Desulfobacteraceae bacterium]
MTWGAGGFIFTGLILWLLLGIASAQPQDIKLHSDGSIVIAEATSPTATPDWAPKTAQEVLASDVQVYIFRNSSRVCPPPPTSPAKTLDVRQSTPGNRLKRASRLEPLIDKYARVYGVDKKLVRAVMRQESGFNPQAVSPKGAMGLMQLMPETAALMGVRNPFDPEQNIAGGVRYLKRCLVQFQDVRHALAAYNAGPENVVKYNGCPPFAETRNYVATIMQNYSGTAPQPGPAPGSSQDSSSSQSAAKPTPPKPRWHTYRLASGIPVKVCYSPSGKAKIIKVLPRTSRRSSR